MQREEVPENLLGKSGIDVWVDLGDTPRGMDGNDRHLMILQFGESRHFVHCGGNLILLFMFYLDVIVMLNRRIQQGLRFAAPLTGKILC